MTTLNGIDGEELTETINAVAENPTAGQFQFRAETEWQDGLQSVTAIEEFDHAGKRVRTREFQIEGDEPEEILGERTAPNAVELLLAALGSCLSVGYAANATAMGIDIETLRFEMDGTVDLRGFLGLEANVRPGYEHVTCTTYLEADATDAELADLRERVEGTSPLLDNTRNELPVKTELVVGQAP